MSLFMQIWDASGQGRFCTIIRSYSRGAQGIILVYDITNKWSFEGINRWIKEVEEHAPGIPKVLVGNRLHLAFKRQVLMIEFIELIAMLTHFMRQVAAKQAENYASRHKMQCFEISPLCDFNIRESFCELARMALHRNGMERIWRTNKGELINDRSNQTSFANPLLAHFSFVAARALLSNHSQTNQKCLLNRPLTTTDFCQVPSQVLRIDNHTKHLSEQFSE